MFSSNKPSSKDRCAHHFDFDQTLTKKHVSDWKNAPTQEACIAMLKPAVLETLRAIFARGDYISIITNGNGYRVPYILQQAGLTPVELSKITLYAANSPKYIVSGYKSKVISELSEKWGDAKYHYFYDDLKEFRDEVRDLQIDFEMKDKFLEIVSFIVEADNIDHLIYAQEISGLCSELNGEVSIFLAQSDFATTPLQTININPAKASGTLFASSESDSSAVVTHAPTLQKHRRCVIL
jgi:hypothetical protein